MSELEGVRSEVLAFRNGTGIVTWDAPYKWRISGGGRRITLIPPDASQADAVVEIAGPPSPGEFDETFIKKLKAEVTASLTRGSTGLDWSEDEPDALLINRHPVYKVALSYSASGSRFVTTVWVCNFEKQQLRFRLTARAENSSKLQEAFRQSLYTWQGLQ
ncbi:hypothetical protein ACXR0O_24390 [Verrucomicrobiota bacterium sgz303538]